MISQGDDEGGARPKSDRDMEMELTFEGGLEALGQRLLSKKQEHDARKKDTVWEAYERRRRCLHLGNPCFAMAGLCIGTMHDIHVTLCLAHHR